MSCFCVVRFIHIKEPFVVPRKYIFGEDFDLDERCPFSRYVMYNPDNLDAPIPSPNIMGQYKRKIIGVKDFNEMEIGMLYPGVIIGVFGN